MARTKSPPFKRPAKDEWGVYDPQQAGLAALYARLEARARIEARERIAAAPPAPVKKEASNPAPVGPVFRAE